MKGLRKSTFFALCMCPALALMLLLPVPGSAQQKGGPAKTLKIGYLFCLSG